MKLFDLKNKKIAFFGLGIENQALLRYLIKQNIKADYYVVDQRGSDALRDRLDEFRAEKNIKWVLGSRQDSDFPAIDIVFRSPGWPLFDSRLKQASGSGAKITSALQLFCDLCPSRNLIGVTGTKGKGTTSSLIAEILLAGGKKVFLGGNIGLAPWEFFDQIDKDAFVVLELSSFQLQGLCVDFKAGVFTNFSREHLLPADPNNPNHHKNMAEYFSAKLNLFCRQSKNHAAIINEKLREKFKAAEQKGLAGAGKKIFFKKSNLPTPLIGDHNKENIAAAEAVAKALGIGKKAVASAVAGFSGLEHRLEFVAEKNGIKYYNDSFATMPDASITALKSFKSPIILIAGGADKGSNFRSLAHEIEKRVKFLVLFEGAALPRLKQAVIKAGFKKDKVRIVPSMPLAIEAARQNAAPGDIVLLSPACASFGIFKNYKERGRLFKEYI